MDLTALTQTFPLGSGGTGRLVSLPALAAAGFGDMATLPVSLRIVLESVLRNCDGKRITEDDVRRLAQWEPTAERTAEIPFVVARVLLQDFTGVPLLCDLAAMRSALERMGRDPALIEPLVPVDLVIDHSVQVDFTGRERNLPTLGGNGLGGNGTPADPLTLNMQLEFERNRERYEFLKWGMQAFRTFRVIPPGIGICHQVNLEYLAQGVLSRDDLYFPDTLVGTDSHTTMINGLGIVGWGVGGIEAEAAMLGQPVSFLTPDVVGVNLKGRLREGVTATDLVLTVTEMLRKAGVVGKFVEFHGEGAAELSVPDRATIANMAPEYGATMGFFPVDEKTCAYLLATGRSPEHVATVRNYFEAQGMFGIPAAGACRYSTVLELDLATVEASVAGPKRPQDRIAVGRLAPAFGESLQKPVREGGFGDRTRCGCHTPCRKRSLLWRPWPRGCRHCRHHFLHEHVKPQRDAGCRSAGTEGGGARAARAPHGQDLAGPRLTRCHSLPGKNRPAARPAAGGLRCCGLWLHDLHRQLGAA
jgi:aconitate hydratase